MTDAPPPPYEESPSSRKWAATRPENYTSSTHLGVPRNGIPASHRRSMEDEGRPLPTGWVRQYDAKESHQYFVDTKANPPRSIWHHPHDDEQYLSTLSSEERERLQAEARTPSPADIAAESSADESDAGEPPKNEPPNHRPNTLSSTGTGTGTPPVPPRPHDQKDGGGAGKFGRRLKDKVTGTTHEQREREREHRAREEQEAYARHQQIRSAMTRAMETGEPQFVGQNAKGQDVYIEPPRVDPYGNPVYPGGYAGRGGGYQAYNPYTQGPYANPNNRFVAYPRPNYAYGRPYGYGYGGGMGVPLAGGLLGGMMLGGLLF